MKYYEETNLHESKAVFIISDLDCIGIKLSKREHSLLDKYKKSPKVLDKLKALVLMSEKIENMK